MTDQEEWAFAPSTVPERDGRLQAAHEAISSNRHATTHHASTHGTRRRHNVATRARRSNADSTWPAAPAAWRDVSDQCGHRGRSAGATGGRSASVLTSRARHDRLDASSTHTNRADGRGMRNAAEYEWYATSRLERRLRSVWAPWPQCWCDWTPLSKRSHLKSTPRPSRAHSAHAVRRRRRFERPCNCIGEVN